MFDRKTTPLVGYFVRDQRGSVAIIFALAMLPLFIAVGVAIDLGRAVVAKDHLQNATDAGALAGARLPATAKKNREDVARALFTGNLPAAYLTNVTPTIAASNADVSVTASFNMPTAFMSIVGIQSVTVVATTRARSQVQNGGVACLLALNPTTNDGLHLQGINKFSEQNCWAWVNSTSSSAINAAGAATGTAQGFCSAGGVSGADHFAPAPFTQCDPLPDPFANMRAPSPSGCTASNLVLKNGSYTLNPGTYCGGLVLKPQAEVTFTPGVYIVKDGLLEVQGQSSASGTGVVFVFTGSGAQLIVRGGGNIDLTAPVAGAWGVGDLAGFLFFQDRFTTNVDTQTIIQGGGSVKLEGILYMPTWFVDIGGNGDINQTTRHWAMIADHFYMEGNGKMYLRSNPTESGQPDILPKIPTGPMLLQ